jgi:ABC-type polysaccharide/polyol phosphate transport system ATPase subunit
MINLRFDRVSKRYRIDRESKESRDLNPLTRKFRNLIRGGEDFWALRNVSFEVSRGEAVGIIGHNGAGKSTILKLLYNITTPTEGEITIHGKLSALIEVASGFHPELTGRENVYLNGSLLGMKRNEITSKLDSIVEFAGVAKFIDTPVKRYSSGMYLRLGFAIAAHLDPDILLLDEVLAVGDAGFQAKCIDRITELKRAGNTIVFVSHNLGAVESLCDRVLLVNQGQIVMSGPPREVIGEYEKLQLSTPASETRKLTIVKDSPPVEIVSLTFLNDKGQRTTMFQTGSPARAEVRFLAHEAVKDVVFELYFYSVYGNLHTHISTEVGNRIDLEPGNGIIEFYVPEMLFEVAAFNVEVSVKHRGSHHLEHINYKHGTMINVGRGVTVHGNYHMPHTWQVKQMPEPAYEPELDVVGDVGR